MSEHIYICPCCDAQTESDTELKQEDEITCGECGTDFFWDGEQLLEVDSEDDEFLDGAEETFEDADEV